MKKLNEKRKLDYFKQVLYFYEHPNCEICGKPAVHVHHIVFRSEGGKCEEDNMISTCQENHDQAHFKKKPYLHKEDLWKIKGLDIEIMREKYRIARLGCKQN